MILQDNSNLSCSWKSIERWLELYKLVGSIGSDEDKERLLQTYESYLKKSILAIYLVKGVPIEKQIWLALSYYFIPYEYWWTMHDFSVKNIKNSHEVWETKGLVKSSYGDAIASCCQLLRVQYDTINVSEFIL